MNIFICWSGRRGKSAADHLATWLKTVFGDRVTPKVSIGIDKGVRWLDELHEFVNESSAGLLCMTPEALQSPSVNYEAGMLSRAVGTSAACPLTGNRETGRLYTFLFGVSATDLKGPLAAFQSSDASDERDVRRLVESLAATLVDPTVQPATLDERWPDLFRDLRDGLAIIPTATLEEVCPDFEKLFRRKTFEEPTHECVDQRWLERYEGARETLRAITERRRSVESACRGYAVELYRDLEAAVDSYAIAISLLADGPRFSLDDAGRVKIEPVGVARACEERRRHIRRLVARLVDPRQAPFFDTAARFDAAEEFAEKKNLIHRRTTAVQKLADEVARAKPAELSHEWPADAFCFDLVQIAQPTNKKPPASTDGRQVDLEPNWRMSDWDFDRIMYALFLEQRIRTASDEKGLVKTAVEFAEAELEKMRRARARPRGGSERASGTHRDHVIELCAGTPPGRGCGGRCRRGAKDQRSCGRRDYVPRRSRHRRRARARGGAAAPRTLRIRRRGKQSEASAGRRVVSPERSSVTRRRSRRRPATTAAPASRSPPAAPARCRAGRTARRAGRTRSAPS